MIAVNDILERIPLDQLAAELGTDEATAEEAARGKVSGGGFGDIPEKVLGGGSRPAAPGQAGGGGLGDILGGLFGTKWLVFENDSH